MRGENARKRLRLLMLRGSSPHARGKPNEPLRIAVVRRAHPRMRGENQTSGDALGKWAGSSPHARGKLPAVIVVHFWFRLIPACAGKTGVRIQDWLMAQAHPRMRGENRLSENQGSAMRGSSPHARGKPNHTSKVKDAWGLIPACAGKTRKHQ